VPVAVVLVVGHGGHAELRAIHSAPLGRLPCHAACSGQHAVDRSTPFTAHEACKVHRFPPPLPVKRPLGL
jgi:hypothetical protein